MTVVSAVQEATDQGRRRNTYPWPLWYNSVIFEMDQNKVALAVDR